MDEENENCPHCGQKRITDLWDYPREWACGTTLNEWKQGWGAVDPVPQQSEACKAIITAQSERDEARAKLASLVPGVVRIQEPTIADLDAILAKNFEPSFLLTGYVKDAIVVGIRGTLAWARTHAEVVVEAVVLPELKPDGLSARGFTEGYALAVSRLRAMQQAREVVG